jgi:hypothetical protein
MWAKKVDFWNPEIYFSENNFMFLGVSLCGNRVRAFPNPENASLVLIQGKNWIFVNAKMTIFASKTQFFPETGKDFQCSVMRSINSRIKLPVRDHC